MKCTHAEADCVVIVSFSNNAECFYVQSAVVERRYNSAIMQ
jgi:hypothetical protein